MSIFTDMYKPIENSLPIDRTSVHTEFNLEKIGNKWMLVEEDADTVVSLAGQSRSGTPTTQTVRPFIDNTEYTFGISVTEVKDKTKPKDTPKELVVTKTDKTKTAHDAYIKCLADSHLAETDPSVKDLIEFLSNDPYEQLIAGQSEAAVEAINQRLLKCSGSAAIRVCVGADVLAEKYASNFSEVERKPVRCSITGQMSEKLDIKPETLKGVFGSTMGLVTISCNTNAFPVVNNYNFDNYDGSPVSTEAYVTITRNLQKLFSDEKCCRKIPNSNGVSYLLCYDNVDESIQGTVGAIINTPYKPDELISLGFDVEDLMDDTDESVKTEAKKVFTDEIVHKKYMSLRNGTVYKKSASGTATVYRIHRVNGRWSCTDTFKLDLSHLFANIDQWYNDIEPAGRTYSIMNLLRSSIAESAKVDHREYENLVQTILVGGEINRNILKRILQRIRTAHNGISRCQYALIRACYNSKARHNHTKELPKMLDKTNTSYAYNMGRLIAVGDYMQYKANENIETPLSGRMDKRAIVRPNEAKAEILRRIEIYKRQLLPKKDKRGVIPFINTVLDEIVTQMNCSHDGVLSVDEQAEMRTAFIQQTNEFYKKNTNPSTED